MKMASLSCAIAAAETISFIRRAAMIQHFEMTCHHFDSIIPCPSKQNILRWLFIFCEMLISLERKELFFIFLNFAMSKKRSVDNFIHSMINVNNIFKMT